MKMLNPKEAKSHVVYILILSSSCLPWAGTLMGHCFIYLVPIAVSMPENIFHVGHVRTVKIFEPIYVYVCIFIHMYLCLYVYIHTHITLIVWIQSHHKCKLNPVWRSRLSWSRPWWCCRAPPACLTSFCLFLLDCCLVLASKIQNKNNPPNPHIYQVSLSVYRPYFPVNTKENPPQNLKLLKFRLRKYPSEFYISSILSKASCFHITIISKSFQDKY